MRAVVGSNALLCPPTSISESLFKSKKLTAGGPFVILAERGRNNGTRQDCRIISAKQELDHF